MIRLPDHIRCDVTVYMIDELSGAEIAFGIFQAGSVPESGDFDSLIKKALKVASASDVMKPRLMTAEEVEDYLKRQAAEEDA